MNKRKQENLQALAAILQLANQTSQTQSEQDIAARRQALMEAQAPLERQKLEQDIAMGPQQLELDKAKNAYYQQQQAAERQQLPYSLEEAKARAGQANANAAMDMLQRQLLMGQQASALVDEAATKFPMRPEHREQAISHVINAMDLGQDWHAALAQYLQQLRESQASYLNTQAR